MLKTRILAAVVLAMLVVAAILGVATFILRNNADELYQQSSHQGAGNLLNKVIDNSADRMEANASFLARNSEMMAALQDKDLDSVASASVGTFNRLSSSGIISALRIFDPQGAPIVAHGADAQSAGDRSALVASVIGAGKATRGLERTAQGVPVARFVFPLLQRGDLVGVAVLEKTFASILDEVAKASVSATALMSLEHAVIEATDKPLFAGLSAAVARGAADYVKVSHGGAHFGVLSLTLRDNDAKPLGIVVVARDNSAAYAKDARITFLTVAVSLAVFALCVGLLWRYVRTTFGPLDRMVEVMDRIQRNWDLSERVPIDGPQDEVGRTARAFNRLLEVQQHAIGEVNTVVGDIAAAAQSMSAAGAQVEKGSAVQSEAAATVAAAVQQTSVSISATAGNAQAADETVTRARADIEKTLAAVRETVANVDGLADMIGAASGDVARLAESSRQIEGIVQTIKDIADQTNLLALNAAIEAARAGEQGRGFAVVADEVRKLAESTTSATSEISGLIGGIQSEVDAAVARMQEANDKAGTTRERVVASTGALDAASDNTGRVTESVRNIADAVREQDVAVQQVAQRIEQIARMTEENTGAAANAADAARHLDELAGKLRTAVGRFKV